MYVYMFIYWIPFFDTEMGIQLCEILKKNSPLDFLSNLRKRHFVHRYEFRQIKTFLPASDLRTPIYRGCG